MSISYMQRRKSGIYEFRQRLPESIAGKPVPAHLTDGCADLVNPKTGRFKRELVKSLGTHEQAKARKANLREAQRALDLFEKANDQLLVGPPRPISPRSGMASAEIAGIEAEAYAEVLRGDDRRRADGDPRVHEQSRAERASRPLTDQVHDADPDQGLGRAFRFMLLQELRILVEEYDDRFKRRDISNDIRRDTQRAIDARAISVEPRSADFVRAALAIITGRKRGYEEAIRRHHGEDIKTPEPQPLKPQAGPKLSEAAAHWKAGSPARGSHKPSANTVREADYAVRRFTEYHGDVRLGDITREKVRHFRDALARVPTRLPSAMQRLGLRELIALDHEGRPTVHSGTVNKLLTMLSAITTFAMKEGLVDAVPNFANPFVHMKITVDDTAEEARNIFEPEHLDAIFSTPVYTQGARPAGGGGEAAYWLPLIAYFSGARQSELAQLRIEDLRQDRETGVWLLDISTKGGRTMKTATSRRKVPVHPELKRLGLLGYRQGLLDRGAKPGDALWPDIKSDSSGRRAGPYSKWFNRYLRDVASIADTTRVFHSFRHTFKRLARDVMEEEISDAITGHKGEGGVGRDYGRGVGLKKLAEAIGKLEVPRVVQSLPKLQDK